MVSWATSVAGRTRNAASARSRQAIPGYRELIPLLREFPFKSFFIERLLILFWECRTWPRALCEKASDIGTAVRRSHHYAWSMEHGTWSGGSRAGLAFSVGFAYEISTELAGGKELTG